MTSILSDLEYDIFISYRLNDNSSGWVSGFVKALQEELAVTIKEPVSLYFDTNAHDGLLEMHNVDKSIRDKLKCLIFIPIISKTYCDPKSFAWQHEFCAFNKLLQADQLGREVVLANGNVASRILPVKIHDLDQEDTALLESELGMGLRAIEFIYKSFGVNRPLRIDEDHPQDNMNKTYYRDQINKVANAVHEIIRSIKSANTTVAGIDPGAAVKLQINKMSFRSKLIERNVIRASLVYILCALILWKVLIVSSSLLNLSYSNVQLVALVLFILFPVSIFMSWQYERSPEGFIRTGSPGSLRNPYNDEQKKPLTSYPIISLLFVTTSALYMLFPQITVPSMNNTGDKEKSIAVLPFVNDSPDQENSYFINGIMDEILNNLQKIKDFRVLSRTSTEQYRGTNKPTIPEIAKKLDVNYIVEGSGQKFGNKFRLRVQLITARNEKRLWSYTVDQEIKQTSDIIHIQSEIAQSIASELEVVITPEERQIIEKPPTTSLTAYDFYHRGKEEYSKYWLNEDNREALKKAEDLYHKALEYDPSFALAYSGLAKIYYSKHYYDEYFSENFMDSVLILANIALSNDNRLAEAYNVRGVYYALRGFTNKAIEEFDNAIKLNPNDWTAYKEKGDLYVDNSIIKSLENLQKAVSLNHGTELPDLLGKIAYAYNLTGYTDKAKYYTLEALKLDGDSVTYYLNLGQYEMDHKMYEDAIELINKSYLMDKNRPRSLNYLGFSNMLLGRYKESLKYYSGYVARLNSLGRFTINNMHRVGFVYLKNGFRKEAGFYFDKQIDYCLFLIKSGRASASTYYDLAGVYAFRGDKLKALGYLGMLKKNQRFSFGLAILIKIDPLFDSIRDEPEFQEIAAYMDNKYQAECNSVRKWQETKAN